MLCIWAATAAAATLSATSAAAAATELRICVACSPCPPILREATDNRQFGAGLGAPALSSYLVQQEGHRRLKHRACGALPQPPGGVVFIYLFPKPFTSLSS